MNCPKCTSTIDEKKFFLSEEIEKTTAKGYSLYTCSVCRQVMMINPASQEIILMEPPKGLWQKIKNLFQ